MSSEMALVRKSASGGCVGNRSAVPDSTARHIQSADDAKRMGGHAHTSAKRSRESLPAHSETRSNRTDTGPVVRPNEPQKVIARPLVRFDREPAAPDQGDKLGSVDIVPLNRIAATLTCRKRKNDVAAWQAVVRNVKIETSRPLIWQAAVRHPCRNIETVPHRYLHHLGPELESTVPIQGQSKLTFVMEVRAERRDRAPGASGILEAGAATLARI